MRLRYVYKLNDGRFLYGGPGEPDYNPAEEGVTTVERHPDLVAERYDNASPSRIRSMTAEERTTAQAERQADREQGLFHGQKMVLAIALWVAQRLGVPAAQARNEILGIFRTL